MRRPRLLDLFCGAGGASVGYARAGFEVVGVDIRPQPHYPFEFHLADATTYPLDGFDAVHASPPCQPYSKAVTSASSEWNDTLGKDEPALIDPIRDRLVESGLPYVIENVVGAPLRGPILLCGSMVDLPIQRHRLFEVVPRIFDAFDVPRHPACSGRSTRFALERGWDPRDMTVTGKGRHAGTSERWAEIMGIDWPMRQRDLKEAIPPAYTEWIGRQLLASLPALAGAV